MFCVLSDCDNLALLHCKFIEFQSVLDFKDHARHFIVYTDFLFGTIHTQNELGLSPVYSTGKLFQFDFRVT